MKNILLNLKQIDQTKIKHTEKGNEFVSLKMVKLKNPKGLITHMIFHKQEGVPLSERSFIKNNLSAQSVALRHLPIKYPKRTR